MKHPDRLPTLDELPRRVHRWTEPSLARLAPRHAPVYVFPPNLPWCIHHRPHWSEHERQMERVPVFPRRVYRINHDPER